MMELPPKKIQLNDGSELEVNWCGAAEGVLWIDGLNLTLLEALPIFSNPSKTASITAPDEKVHTGYTQLIHISINYDGLVKVALRKAV
jgi:hypothetical protein